MRQPRPGGGRRQRRGGGRGGWGDGCRRRDLVASLGGAGAGPAGDHPEELVLVDRLGEHVVHAGGHHPLALVLHRVGGQGDDGQLRVLGLDDGGGLVAVHHGHLQVEEDEVEGAAAHGLDGLLPVVGEGHAGGGHLDEGGAHLAVEGVVVHEQEMLVLQPRDRRGVGIGGARADGLRAAFEDGEQGLGDGADGNRLAEDTGEQGVGVRGEALRPDPRDQDDRLAEAFGAQGFGDLLAVHFGHVPVEHQDVEGRARAQQLEGRPAGGGGGDAAAEGFDDAGQELEHDRVVVHHQDRLALQGRRRAVGRGRRGQPETGDEAELRPLAGFGVEPQRSAHLADQLLGDRQPEAAAAEAAGGRAVGLGEGAEDAGLLFRGHADAGIRDRETQPGRRPGVIDLDAVDQHGDRAAVGELDGVADQVDQHLAEPVGVAHQPRRHRGAEADDQLDGLAARGAAQQHVHVPEHLVELELGILEFELAGLDLGDVEDVVDQRQQRLAGAVDLAERRHGLFGVVLVQGDAGEPDDGADRGTDLVAHVGQEGRLGLGGHLGPGQGVGELVLDPALLDDVPHHADEDAALVVDHLVDDDLEGKPLARLALAEQLDAPVHLDRDRVAGARLARQQDADGLADEFVLLVAEDLGQRVIDVDDGARGVHLHHAVAHGAQDRLAAGGALLGGPDVVTQGVPHPGDLLEDLVELPRPRLRPRRQRLVEVSGGRGVGEPDHADDALPQAPDGLHDQDAEHQHRQHAHRDDLIARLQVILPGRLVFVAGELDDRGMDAPQRVEGRQVAGLAVVGVLEGHGRGELVGLGGLDDPREVFEPGLAALLEFTGRGPDLGDGDDLGAEGLPFGIDPGDVEADLPDVALFVVLAGNARPEPVLEQQRQLVAVVHQPGGDVVDQAEGGDPAVVHAGRGLVVLVEHAQPGQCGGDQRQQGGTEDDPDVGRQGGWVVFCEHDRGPSASAPPDAEPDALKRRRPLLCGTNADLLTPRAAIGGLFFTA